MPINDIQTSFAGGELSPQLYARVDLAKYQVGAALLRNFFSDYRGGATNRAGTEFIADISERAAFGDQRLIPFIVSSEASYVLVFSEGLIEAYFQGVLVDSIGAGYLAEDLFKLKYSQSADVLTITHPSYPPCNLTRTSDTTFDFAAVVIGPTVQPPVINEMRAPHSGPYSFGYLVTSVDLDGKEESLPSNIGVKHSEAMNEETNRVVGLSWTHPGTPILRYNIFKWGPIDAVTLNPATVWGFIGSAQTNTFTDNNIAPDYSKQAPLWGDPFSGGQFQSITVTSGGSGYDGVSGDWPAIPFVPLSIVGDGFDAAGFAVIDHDAGTIIGAYFTNAGRGYTTATITADGEGGTGATFTYTLSAIEPLYPACVSYLQQRRTYAGSNINPETFIMSQPGLYDNFNTTPVSLATDAIAGTVASLQVNTIKSLVPVSYGLLAFTSGGCWLIGSTGGPTGAISPATISATQQASPGANDLPPLQINYDIIFGAAKGNKALSAQFAWERQSYTVKDITELAPHLFDTYRTVDWTWAESPDKMMWLVRNDGRMLACTYVPEEEVFAWSRHDTQGQFKSVCAVPENGEDAVYVIVRRSLASGPSCDIGVTYLERLHSRQGCCIFDAWFLDSGLEYPSNTLDSPIIFGAAEGDTTMTICDAGTGEYMRGPTVSYNALAANADLFSSICFFDFVVPADWDNTAGESLDITVTGGIVPVGATPLGLQVMVQCGLWTVDGGSALSATLSGSGLSFAIGSVTHGYGPGVTTPWETAGLNQGASDRIIFSDEESYVSSTLVDGTTWGQAGEGFADVAGLGTGPIGWFPSLDQGNTNDGTAHAKLTPGQTVTVWFTIFNDVDDPANPDREAFAAIQYIALSYKGTDYPIDISAVKVGFSAGDNYDPLLSSVPEVEQFPNPARTIETTPPSSAHPNQQTYTDFYFIEDVPTVLAEGDVVSVGCAQATITDNVDAPVYDVTLNGNLFDFVVPDDPNGVVRRIEADEWTYNTPTQIVSGLDHLEGKEVWALADGVVVGPLTVTAGAVDLGDPYSKIVVGLKYTQQIKTLYLTAEGINTGSEQGKRKLIPEVTLRVDCSKGLKVGGDFDNLTPVPDLILPDTLELFTGDAFSVIFADWDVKGEVCIQQDYPLPASILGVIPGVLAGDTAR